MGYLCLVLTDVFTLRNINGPIFSAVSEKNELVILIFDNESVYYLDVLIENNAVQTKNSVFSILSLNGVSFEFEKIHESSILDNINFEIPCQNVSLLRLRFKTNSQFSKANSKLLAAGFILYSNTWNSSQNAHTQYMVDNDLKFYEWYSCQFTTIKHITPVPIYMIKMDSFSSVSKNMIPFSPIIVYYDLEVFSGPESTTKTSVPNPEILSNYITHCSIVIERDSEMIFEAVLHNTRENLKPPNIACSSEKELLYKFFLLLHEYGCNLLVGFNNFYFDSDWIMKRSSTHELENHVLRLFLGELIDKWSNASFSDHVLYYNLIVESGKQALQKRSRIPGIHELDMMNMLTRNFPRATDEGIGLNNWLRHFKLEEKTAMSFPLFQLLILYVNGTSLPISPTFDVNIENKYEPENLIQAIKEEAEKLGYSREKSIMFLTEQVAIYNLRDSVALFDLNQKTGVIKMGLGNLLMAPITALQAIHGGVSLIVIPYLVYFIKLRNILVGCRTSQGMETSSSIQGGVVIPPVFESKGIFSTPILIFDFNSLYPNVIISNSISPENISYSEVPQEGIEIQKNSSSIFFKHNDKSIFPSLCSFLLSERNSVKKIMKTEKDPEKKEWLDRRQLGLKLIANSIYGILASNAHQIHSFISKDLASAITHMAGVYTLIMARAATKIAKLNVIGGDTDSIFIEIPRELWELNGLYTSQTVEEKKEQIRLCWKIAAELEYIFQKVLNELFPKNTLKFVYEGTFCAFVPLAPKHYCGAYRDDEKSLIVYETGISLHSIAKCRGLNLIRRGVNNLVKIFEHAVLFEAVQLNNNKSLDMIAEEQLMKILKRPDLNEKMSKAVNVSLANASETQMSWRWFRIILGQFLEKSELIWPSFAVREMFVVIQRPPYRNEKGQKVFDLLSAHSIPVRLLEFFQGDVDLGHYFERLPLDQFLAFKQKPAGNRVTAKKASQEIIQKHLSAFQETLKPLTKSSKSQIAQNIVVLLKSHWSELCFLESWIKLIYLNMPTEPKFAFGKSIAQMIMFWSYRLVKLLELSNEQPLKELIDKVSKHPLIKKFSLLCVCLRFAVLEWSSYFWAQITNPMEPRPHILYLLLPLQLLIEKEIFSFIYSLKPMPN